MMASSTRTDVIEDDLETMRGAFGLCVGQLNEHELSAFNRLCASGHARRSYRGMMGIMGLAYAEREYVSSEE